METSKIDAEIKNAELSIEALACRISLISTEQFQNYQAQAVQPQIKVIEQAILMVRSDGPPSEYELGVLQGQRQALLGLTFDEAECHNAIQKLKARIVDLQEQKKIHAQRSDRFQDPERKGGRSLYAEVESTQPQGEWE